MESRLAQQRARHLDSRFRRFGRGHFRHGGDFFITSTTSAKVKAWRLKCYTESAFQRWENLAAAVAHEVRNPLNAISMGLQRLKLKFQPTEDRRTTLVCRTVCSARHRLNTIVEQFLRWRALSRLTRACRSGNPEGVSRRKTADAKRSQVQSGHRAPNLPPLQADPSHLTQVLLNLMAQCLQRCRTAEL